MKPTQMDNDTPEVFPFVYNEDFSLQSPEQSAGRVKRRRRRSRSKGPIPRPEPGRKAGAKARGLPGFYDYY